MCSFVGVPDAFILTREGLKTISSIQVGEYVMCWAENPNYLIHNSGFQRYYDKVTAFCEKEVCGVYCLTYKNKISLTDSHLMVTDDSAFLVARRKSKLADHAQAAIERGLWFSQVKPGKFWKWTRVKDLVPGNLLFMANETVFEIEGITFESCDMKMLGICLEKNGSCFVGEHGVLTQYASVKSENGQLEKEK